MAKQTALWKYFTTKEPTKEEAVEEILPKPDGPLSMSMPSSAIAAANSTVREYLLTTKGSITTPTTDDEAQSSNTRGVYQVFSDTERAEIGKIAAESGIASAMRHFSKLESGKPSSQQRKLSPSTVHGWKVKYLEALNKKRGPGESRDVTALPKKKRGRPLLLGKELDKHVETFLRQLRANGVVINTAIVMATAEGIVCSKDSNLLAQNGGPILISKYWAKSLMTRMNFVKRKATTKVKISNVNFEECKAQFVYDVKAIMELEEIPDDLVINWDHTGIHYVPVSNWTMEAEGSKRVAIAGIDDKRQITAVLSVTMSGHFLPPQIIYKGTTRRSLPTVSFPAGWNVTFTENHWANEITTLQYIDEILLPYVKQKRRDLKLSDNQSCLVIFDRFKAQCTATVLDVLRDNNILIALVPANCTDRLQPLDVSVNKSVKEFLRGQFHKWYAGEVCSQLHESDNVQAVDLSLSVVKPLGAIWLINLFDYLHTHPEIARNGFRKAGLLT